MNERNFHESTKSRMKWLAICMGTAILISPLPGVAQSNTAPQTKTVRMWDACDPVSFDAAVTPGTCLAGHHGQTKFLDFINELQLDGIAGGWRFNPLLNTSADTFKLVQLELKPGDRISLQNIGGENSHVHKSREVRRRIRCSAQPHIGQP